jgi:hypothetical protein
VLNGQAAANLALGRYPEAEGLLLEAQNKVKSKHKFTEIVIADSVGLGL